MQIKLVVSDVDGTMVTGETQLTPATIAAARRLQAPGIPCPWSAASAAAAIYGYVPPNAA